jgi:hypothetical protein
VQFSLERELMVLFASSVDSGRLRLTASGDVNGARYVFALRFEAALPHVNCYSLQIDTSWEAEPATHVDYYRKTSDSWFELWTRDLMMAPPPDPDDGLEDRYQDLVGAALVAEQHLDSVSAIQREILTAMQHGRRFATSHKEGGTDIFWRDGVFVRSDHGDTSQIVKYRDEAEFLTSLRQFCQWEVARHAIEARSEFDVWKLILRRLRPGSS